MSSCHETDKRETTTKKKKKKRQEEDKRRTDNQRSGRTAGPLLSSSASGEGTGGWED